MNMNDKEWNEFWDHEPEDEDDEYNDVGSDIDANNDETFDNAAEWNEDEHEELIARDSILSNRPPIPRGSEPVREQIAPPMGLSQQPKGLQILTVYELEKELMETRISQMNQKNMMAGLMTENMSRRAGWSPFSGKDLFNRDNQEHPDNREHRDNGDHRYNGDHRDNGDHRENRGHRDHRDYRDHREHRDHRDHREHREQRDHRESRDHRNHRESRDHRELRDHRDNRDYRDHHCDRRDQRQSRDHRDQKDHREYRNREHRDQRDHKNRRQRSRYIILPPQVQLSVLDKARNSLSINTYHPDEFLQDIKPTSKEGFLLKRHSIVSTEKINHDGVLTESERNWLTRIQEKIQADYDDNLDQDYYYLLYFNRSSATDEAAQKPCGPGVLDRRFIPRERLLYTSTGT